MTCLCIKQRVISLDKTRTGRETSKWLRVLNSLFVGTYNPPSRDVKPREQEIKTIPYWGIISTFLQSSEDYKAQSMDDVNPTVVFGTCYLYYRGIGITSLEEILGLRPNAYTYRVCPAAFSSEIACVPEFQSSASVAGTLVAFRISGRLYALMEKGATCTRFGL